jgi:hypothetical protein
MKLHDLNTATIHRYKECVNQIQPDTSRNWGKMEPIVLLAHLRRTIELSLGEVPEVKDVSVPVVRTVLRKVFFDWFTNWPKGKLKAPPIFFAPSGDDFERERELLLVALDRFVAALDDEPDREELSPLLGPLTLRYWAHLHAVHSAHHFRQFGMI